MPLVSQPATIRLRQIALGGFVCLTAHTHRVMRDLNRGEEPVALTSRASDFAPAVLAATVRRPAA